MPPAIRAPVFPQETTTDAAPDFTNSMARTIEASFFRFSACIGLSAIVMTSLACSSCRRSSGASCSWRSSPSSTAVSPTRVIGGSRGREARASLMAATTSTGPRSPLIASSAMRASALGGEPIA